VYELAVNIADTAVKVDGPLAGNRAIDLVDAVPIDTPVGGTALLLRGDPGRGVAHTSISDDHLFITYTDGTTENAGPVNPEAFIGMGNLQNVHESADTSVPSVLVRGTDGIYRSVPTTMFVTEGRASYITYVDNVPVSIPPDAQVGDYFTVINGDDRGSIYQVEDT
jgi:hypothetical protein